MKSGSSSILPTLVSPTPRVQTSLEVSPCDQVTSAIQASQLVAHVLREIKFGGRRFVLRNSLVVMAASEHGLWTHECDDLRIYSCGTTPDESLQEFEAYFAASFDGLVDEKDETLTADALRLKKDLLSHVAHIEVLEK